jgi:AraC family transcriptional regulator of adaptative response/methylated-DNA-[protein]-cysteine methyltransferase
MTILHYGIGATTLGEFFAAASDRGLVMVAFVGAGGLASRLDALRQRYPGASLVEDRESVRELLAGVADLIEHPERETNLPVDVQGSDFELRVWQALRDVAAGTTVTYGDIARASVRRRKPARWAKRAQPTHWPWWFPATAW